MNFLDFVPVAIFEAMGIVAGLSACFVVTVQVWKEHRSHHPSSLTNVFLFGWLLIYLFWCFYGIRFEAIAMWFTNGIAFMLQVLLCFVVLKKRVSSLS